MYGFFLQIIMATVIPHLTSRISRLNILSKPALCITVRAFRKFQIPRIPLSVHFLSSSANGISAHFSCSNSDLPKSQLVNKACSDGGLIVLGIETSCDDTAAAVVSINKCFCFLGYFVYFSQLLFILGDFSCSCYFGEN